MNSFTGASYDGWCEQCVILCTGPSVRTHDLSKIDIPIIGVNWSFLGKHGREGVIHVLSNKVFIDRHQDDFEKLTPKAEYRLSSKPIPGAFVPHRRINYSSIAHLNKGIQIPAWPEAYSIYRHGWVFAGGGPCALQVAVSFGFKDIVFVGLDLNTGDTCHFYESDPGGSTQSGYSRSKLNEAWRIQSEYFRQVKPYLEKRGVRVRNTSPVSKMFEHVPFDEVFND